MASTHRLTAILDLKDKLSGKLRNSIKQTDNFRDANGRLRNSMGRFVSETDKASRQHKKFARDGVADNNRMRSSTAGLVTAIGGIVTAIMSAVSGAKLLKTALKSAMEFEMNEATIQAMFRGDTKGADDYISMISAKALGSPLFNEADYFQNSKTFLSATKDLGELDNMWDIAERLAAMDPFQGLDGAAFAMRELFSGDAISMAKRFEMPKAFLNSIKNLPIADQLKALDKELTKMGFGKDFLEQISDTGLAYKNQIEETFEKGLREIGKHGLEALKPHMKEFLEMLDTPAFETFKQNVGEAFGKALGAAAKAVMYVVKNWSKISPILEAIGVALATAFAASKIAAIVGFVSAAGGLGAVIASLFSPILLIAGAVALLYYAFKNNLFGIKDIVMDAIDFMAPYVSQGWEDTKKAFAVGKSIFGGFIDYMKGDYSKAWHGIADTVGSDNANKIFKVFKTIETTIRPYLDKLKELAESASVILGSFFKFAGGDMTGAFKGLTDHFGSVDGSKIFESFMGIKDTVQNALAGISEIFQSVSETVVNVVQQYWPVVQQIIGKVMDNIVPFLQSAWTIISGIFMTVVPIIVDIVKIAWDYIKQIIEFVMPYVLTIITTVWNVVIDTFMAVWNYIAEIMPMIQTIISTVWEFLQPLITLVMSIIWQDIKNAFTLIWNIISTVMTVIGGIIETAWIFISGIFKAALQILTGDFDGAWQTMQDTVNGAVDKIKETFGKFVDGAMKIGKDFVQGIIDGFLNMWDSVLSTASDIWNSVTKIFSKKQTMNVDVKQSSGPGSVNNYRSQGMSHSGGLDYVPYDRYPALLHRGERVLTKQENDSQRKGNNGVASVVIAKLAETIVVREDADIDKIAGKVADAILEAGGNGA